MTTLLFTTQLNNKYRKNTIKTIFVFLSKVGVQQEFNIVNLQFVNIILQPLHSHAL